MKATKFKIGVGALKIGKREKKYIKQVIDSNRLSSGKFINKFEKEFAKIHNRRYAIFCNSGTSALQVAFHALKKKYGWKDHDEIIVPALTFVASINTILNNRLTPVFVDIESDYFGIDPAKIEEKISTRTVAIEPVHLFGQPCDMDSIVTIAKKHNLAIVEDSCETMFAKHKGRMVGSWGEVSCFSTYAAHLLATGVGGLITTDDPNQAITIKSLFNHGRDGIYLNIDDDDTFDSKKLQMILERRFNFIDTGYSYRGTELEGALGVGQLGRWRSMIKKRQRNAAYLNRQFAPLSSFLQLPQVRPMTDHVYMVYPIVVKEKKILINELLFFLEKNGIETRLLLPTLTQPIYIKIFGTIADNFPVAKMISERGFYIGCHQELTKAELDYMVEVIFRYFKKKKYI